MPWRRWARSRSLRDPVGTVHGVIAMMVAKAGEPIDFPWPPVTDLVDHVMDVHLAALTRRT